MRPGISKFRALMNLWGDRQDEAAEADKIRAFADTHGIVLFFKKGDDYFGSGEDGRMVFARLKNPDDDAPAGWADEATFTAVNLTKLVKGDATQHVFGRDALKAIKVVDQDDVADALKGVAADAPSPFGALRIIKIDRPADRDEAPNFTRADEEE